MQEHKTYFTRQRKVIGINNQKNIRTQKLCIYCKYHKYGKCEKAYKAEFNKFRYCKHYINQNSANYSDNTNTEVITGLQSMRRDSKVG